MEVAVDIDSKLRVRRADLPSGAADEIRAYLTIPNGDKPKALERGDWGAAELPDAFELWEESNGDLVMPRGFAAILRAGIESHGAHVKWIDHTAKPQTDLTLAAQMPVIDMSRHPYEQRTVAAMMEHRQGVLAAPSGSGKTASALEAFRRSGCTGLVLTDKISLAEQWRARAGEHLGIEAGLIRGPQSGWTMGPLTVGMIPTLNRSIQRWAIPSARAFGFVVADEIHHGPAETWQRVISYFEPAYLFGMTATPLEGDWRQRFVEALVGPIFHTVERSELHDLDVLVEPLVEVVGTEFQWQPGGQDRLLSDERTIYRKITEALIANDERNRLIASRAASQNGAAQVVNSDRLEHLRVLRQLVIELGYPEERAWMLTGAEGDAEREAIISAASEGHCIIFSTIAKEGLDIPRLDRLHMAWPVRKALRVEQLVGRIERGHAEKGRPVVVDYADFKEGRLRAQFFARLKVYRRRGFHVLGLQKPE